MKKFVTMAAAAAVLGGTLLAAPSADARPGYRYYGGPGYGYRGGYRGYRGYGGVAAAGIAGLLVGGVIASQQPYYGQPYYGQPYYGNPYYAPRYYAPRPYYYGY